MSKLYSVERYLIDLINISNPTQFIVPVILSVVIISSLLSNSERLILKSSIMFLNFLLRLYWRLISLLNVV